MNADMRIGEVARRAGVRKSLIRYYEQIGLMPEPRRSAGNQRLYGPAHAGRLAFIRHARELGFPLAAIRELLSLADRPDQPCEAVDRIARAQLRAVEERIERLSALRAELKRMLRRCSGGRIADCRVIEVLADHAWCPSDEHGAAP